MANILFKLGELVKSIGQYINAESTLICLLTSIDVFLICYLILIVLSKKIKRKLAKLFIGIVCLILFSPLFGFIRNQPQFISYIIGCQVAGVFAMILFPEKDMYIDIILGLIRSWNKEISSPFSVRKEVKRKASEEFE